MLYAVDTPPQRDAISVRATDDGITIIGPWSVTLSKDVALQYLRTFQTNPKAGFYVERGKVWLSHGVSRIYMTPREALGIVNTIRQHFGPV